MTTDPLVAYRVGSGQSPHGRPTHCRSGPLSRWRPCFRSCCSWSRARAGLFGESGLLVSGAVLGLTDVDALTISMARAGAAGTSPTVAAKAIAIGILANCLLKLGLALLYGTAPFRRLTSAALTAMAVAIAIALGMVR